MSAHSPISALSNDVVSGTAVRELASGIDALYLSGRVDLDEALLADLDRARETARAMSESVPYRLGKVEFGLAPSGWGRYPFRLSHECGLIGLTGSEHLPAVRVQPRGEILHGLGPEATVDAFSDVLTSVGKVRWSVSRVDLFADVQGWWPTVEDRDRFVCRATTRDTFEVSGELTGFQFGRRKGGGLSARVYEKSRQIEQTGTDWWLDKWGEAYRDECPVARVEFEFGRKMLRECAVDSPANVFANTAGLWGYATEWLSYRDRSGDGTRSRWPVAASWEAIRGATLRDRPVTIQRTTTSRQATAERRIRDGLCGYISSYAALKNLDSLGGVLQSAEGVLRLWELETGIPFSERVARKRQEWEWGL